MTKERIICDLESIAENSYVKTLSDYDAIRLKGEMKGYLSIYSKYSTLIYHSINIDIPCGYSKEVIEGDYGLNIGEDAGIYDAGVIIGQTRAAQYLLMFIGIQD